MKNFKNLFVMVFVAIFLALTASACKTVNDNNEVKKNFADVVSIDARYDSLQNGAVLYLSNLTVRFVNKESGYQYGDLGIDLGDGRVESSQVDFPSTNGEEATIAFWSGGTRYFYEFVGEKTVTLKLTIRFLGYTSPPFLKTVTMKTI